jgi:uncharacterized protein (TIGR02646 family)
MRPITKSTSPITGLFNQYEDAKPYLVSRLGLYCSYCERKIPTLLAVEHIEPKDGQFGQPHLEKKWSNFLLACTNCNSCKGSKQVDFSQLLMPDRDNTYHAFYYTDDGKVESNSTLTQAQKTLAENTLKLIGLDKAVQIYKDSNDELVALDRGAQRMEAIATAQVALTLLNSSPNNQMRQAIEIMAVEAGFFSIWMKVFDAFPDMKVRFIRAFKGTEDSGCFDMTTGSPISPAPNLDGLANGGKV